jgi:hypothetical protein
MDKMRKKSIAELGKEPRDLYPPSDPGDIPQLLEKEREREKSIMDKVAGSD